jgi:hypothetical protein
MAGTEKEGEIVPVNFLKALQFSVIHMELEK